LYGQRDSTDELRPLFATPANTPTWQSRCWNTFIPDIFLNLMQAHSTLPALVGGCMQRIEEVFSTHKIDVVIVQGDTATTAATSLAAFYARVPVVHIEAGLRTGDIKSPWPEELNRRLATLATDLHCAPTQYAYDKLLEENIDPASIILSGNPIVDALQWTLQREAAAVATQVRELQTSLKSGNRPLRTDAEELDGEAPLVVLTAHRRENFGKPLEDICSAVLQLTQRFPDHRFVFVTHPNPNAGPVVSSILQGNSSIEIAPPMTYPKFIGLMRKARLIISDSGGIQEEAPTLAIPLLVTRESTERPEAVHCGAAELVGTDYDVIVKRATELLSDASARAKMTSSLNPFGDGRSAIMIMDKIVSRYGAACD
jgi:UDP-N-acetylglucosamine 2-epimerase (non-hydrolysing)